MAFGWIPPPGTKYGPCSGKCDHLDCKRLRSDAGAICHYCDGPIAYDLSFFEMNGKLVHVYCYKTETEKETDSE